MSILVTGMTGFVGSHLTRDLVDKGNDVVGLFRKMRDESTFKALELDKCPNVTAVLGNISILNDVEEVINEFEVDAIYHLAAKVIVKTAAQQPVVTYITNVLGTLNILETVRMVKEFQGIEIPVMVMASDKAYGTSDKLPYVEDYPLNGMDVYSSSKAMVDIMSRSYAFNYNLPITVARPCNIIGEYDFNWSRIVPTLAKTFLNPFDEDERTLTLNKGSYDSKREYIYVKDLSNALQCLIENIEKTKGEAFNISSGEVLSTRQIVNSFCDNLSDKSNVNIVFKERELTFKEIPHQCLDSSKIKSVTSWKPNYTLDECICKIINGYSEWFNKNVDYYNFIKSVKDGLDETIKLNTFDENSEQDTKNNFGSC